MHKRKLGQKMTIKRRRDKQKNISRTALVGSSHQKVPRTPQVGMPLGRPFKTDNADKSSFDRSNLNQT